LQNKPFFRIKFSNIKLHKALIIQKFFKRKDLFDVVISINPISAIKIIKDENIDLLLTDIMMPEMNGIEVLRTVKKDKPSIKVIMMTAFSTMDKINECEQLGACDYITKPFPNLRDVENKILENLDL